MANDEYKYTVSGWWTESEKKEEVKEKKELRKTFKELVKSLKGKKEEIFSLSGIISAFASLLIVIQAFQPLFSYTGWSFLIWPIILIITGAVIIIASVFLTAKTGGAATFFGGGSLFELGIMLIILGAIILLIGFSSSPELLKTIRIGWSLTSARISTLAFVGPALAKISGTTFSYIALVSVSAIALISIKLKSPACYFFPFILWAVLFLVAKPAIAATGITKYTSVERSVNVQYTAPTIPVEGGVSIQYGTKETNYLPATLLGGEPYIYYYSLQNLYEEEEKFKLHPFIKVRYQYATVRFETEQPYTKELNLTSKAHYQDQIYYDPRTMKIETENICYYTESQMRNYHGENVEIACSYDNPTACGEKRVCAKVAPFLCDCLGWTALTCGGYKAYMGMDVWHTGFLRAMGTLFYKKEFFEPIANKKTTQGPFALMPVFFPNPWVEALYSNETNTTQYFKDVKLSLELENIGSKKIKITGINATPINTEINTTVRGFSEDLNDILEVTVKETIGISLLECNDSEIVNKDISSGVRVYKEFCNFTKPSLNVSIIDIKAGKVRISHNLTIDDVKSYCEEGLVKFLNINEIEKTAIIKIMKLVGRTGLCESLFAKDKKNETFAREWKEKIENSLKSVNVLLEVSYESEFTYTSKPIEIYTSTEKCLKYSCCHDGKNMLCPDGWDEARKTEEGCKELY